METAANASNTDLYENLGVEVDADPRVDGEHPDPCDVVDCRVQAIDVLTLQPRGEHSVSRVSREKSVCEFRSLLL